MGQSYCCEKKSDDHEILINFNNIHVDDPTETSVPRNLKKSMPDTTLISRRGFEDGIDGDYIQQQPCLTQYVINRIESLQYQDSINIHEEGFTVRGNQSHDYFRFRRTGVVYLGEWKNNAPNGFGKNYYPNGGMYEGGFVEGIPHGYGRFIMPNGDYYQGQIKYGRANGEGVFESQQSKYKGAFKDNVRHGKGEQKATNFYFSGEYQYGEKKSGLLKYFGNVYEGQFLDGEFSGEGTLTTKQGIYTGSFRNGDQEGYGEFKWADGSFYRGNYHKGAREGYGQYFNNKNSSISKGMWRNGKLHGQGSYIQPRGESHKVIWADNKISAILDK